MRMVKFAEFFFFFGYFSIFEQIIVKSTSQSHTPYHQTVPEILIYSWRFYHETGNLLRCCNGQR